jgi:hypothetical protein
MPSATVVQRTLEIDATSEPLSGRLTGEKHAERRFRGWLELFAVIDDLRIGAQNDRPADA